MQPHQVPQADLPDFPVSVEGVEKKLYSLALSQQYNYLKNAVNLKESYHKGGADIPILQHKRYTKDDRGCFYIPC